jgi:succinyl-diaminopimelate desuccinylase
MESIKILKELIRFRSITPEDNGALEYIREYLKDFEAIWFNKSGIKNLFLYKEFKKGKHFCFGGHIDVVPPGEGWKSNPFEPIEKDGFIWGRGAQDMKSAIASFMCVAKEIRKFNGVLSFLITSDEEGEAEYGTKYALNQLKQIGFLPEYALVGEPTCEKYFGDTVKIGRRGSVNGVIEVMGKQTHAAYPQKGINPIHKTAKVLNRFAGLVLEKKNPNFPPTQIVVTDIRSGYEVTNVTPQKLKMMFNVRNSPSVTLKDIEKRVRDILKEIDCSIFVRESAKPFLTNPHSAIVKNIQKVVKSFTKTLPLLSTGGGTSDARFFSQMGIEVVEFGVRNDTIHAPNERVSIEDVENLRNIYKRFIEEFSKIQ